MRFGWSRSVRLIAQTATTLASETVDDWYNLIRDTKRDLNGTTERACLGSQIAALDNRLFEQAPWS